MKISGERFILNATNAVALAGGGKRKKGAPLGTPVLSFMDCFGAAAPRNDV
jgi:hypothetical protein